MRARMSGTGRALAATMLAAAAAAGPVATAPAAGAATPGFTVVAHRGDAASAPESTNPAFVKAISKGADAIEFDVRFTSTKYPVVLHDLTLDRTTDCSGVVTRYTLTRLAKCDAGSWFHSSYRGTRVPTLDSALKTIAGASGSVKVLLHVKQVPDATMAKRIKEALARRGMTKRAIVIADTAQILTTMKSYGFSKLGLVFSTGTGWKYSYVTHFIPYNATVDPASVSAVQARGAVVWPVENSRNKPLKYLLGLGYIDGALVNQLSYTYALLAKLTAPVVEVVDEVLPPSPAPTPSAGPAPAVEPTVTPEPTATPDPAATEEPGPTPDPVPTQEPAPEPEPAPTSDPVPTPDPVPSEEPAPEPEPTGGPDPGPAPAPEITEPPAPEASDPAA